MAHYYVLNLVSIGSNKSIELPKKNKVKNTSSLRDTVLEYPPDTVCFSGIQVTTAVLNLVVLEYSCTRVYIHLY